MTEKTASVADLVAENNRLRTNYLRLDRWNCALLQVLHTTQEWLAATLSNAEPEVAWQKYESMVEAVNTASRHEV